jgi:TetR/AcrR family transcriptional regulator, transcriptional repressor of bet genes
MREHLAERGKRIPEEARREQLLQAAFDVACRTGIGGLTVRAVAADAGVSHALVLFHYRTKERLVHALLDWLIEAMAVLHVSDDIARFPHPRDRLHALLHQEMARLSHQPEHTRLFLEYWALGVRDPAIRTRISRELERYRQAFGHIMADLLDAERRGPGGATADGLAAVAVSWIHGCAVQAMVDPAEFDTEGYLAAVRRMIGGIA